ncbi:hypothetical protein BKA70DRAFT_1221531 [Coprinopsis sp. MPI-PUGE-AT-0042]|nr:hypothetical protein BKA70DRAFT_1221531 [Coprinopsis sp. MPI-PUGE-AT-0042]
MRIQDIGESAEYGRKDAGPVPHEDRVYASSSTTSGGVLYLPLHQHRAHLLMILHLGGCLLQTHIDREKTMGYSLLRFLESILVNINRFTAASARPPLALMELVPSSIRKGCRPVFCTTTSTLLNTTEQLPLTLPLCDQDNAYGKRLPSTSVMGETLVSLNVPALERVPSCKPQSGMSSPPGTRVVLVPRDFFERFMTALASTDSEPIQVRRQARLLPKTVRADQR